MTSLLSSVGLAPALAAEQLLAGRKQEADLCPEPALSRVTQHRVVAGETVESIAQKYGLISATLLGMNPSLQSGSLTVGSVLRVPPYNGIQVQARPGASWSDLAEAYGVRADVLFEINGCQESPRTVFIPGVNWSPGQPTAGTTEATSSILTRYPLPQTASVLVGYGWQLNPEVGRVVYHSGVDLAADAETPVFAAGSGTVAFVGTQGAYGKLVVINHAQGLQTRYAQLAQTSVSIGQTVRAGDRIGTVGMTGNATQPHLHFEVRANSELGWVARNPSDYVSGIQVGN